MSQLDGSVLPRLVGLGICRQQYLVQGATLGPWAVADDALVGHGDALADGHPQPGADACVASGAAQTVRLGTEEPLE